MSPTTHRDSTSSVDKATVAHIEMNDKLVGENALDVLDYGDKELAIAAARGREAEQRLGLMQAFKKYRWAVLWSVTVSMVGQSLNCCSPSRTLSWSLTTRFFFPRSTATTRSIRSLVYSSQMESLPFQLSGRVPCVSTGAAGH